MATYNFDQQKANNAALDSAKGFFGNIGNKAVDMFKQGYNMPSKIFAGAAADTYNIGKNLDASYANRIKGLDASRRMGIPFDPKQPPYKNTPLQLPQTGFQLPPTTDAEGYYSPEQINQLRQNGTGIKNIVPEQGVEYISNRQARLRRLAPASGMGVTQNYSNQDLGGTGYRTQADRKAEQEAVNAMRERYLKNSASGMYDLGRNRNSGGGATFATLNKGFRDTKRPETYLSGDSDFDKRHMFNRAKALQADRALELRGQEIEADTAYRNAMLGQEQQQFNQNFGQKGSQFQQQLGLQNRRLDMEDERAKASAEQQGIENKLARDRLSFDKAKAEKDNFKPHYASTYDSMGAKTGERFAGYFDPSTGQYSQLGGPKLDINNFNGEKLQNLQGIISYKNNKSANPESLNRMLKELGISLPQLIQLEQQMGQQ